MTAVALPLPIAPPSPSRLAVNIFAIDPAPTVTGWASCIDGHLLSGTRRWKDDAVFEVGAAHWWGRACLLYRRWLTRVLTTLPIDELWVERPGLTSRAGMEGSARVATLYSFAEAILDELNAAGKTICWRGGVGRQAVFKFACGDGRAEKKIMLDVVRTWGFDPRSQDEAMAIAILKYAQR